MICTFSSVKVETVIVGSILHGSNTESPLRFTHAANMPAETAPITSKGFPEISQALLAGTFARFKKCR